MLGWVRDLERKVIVGLMLVGLLSVCACRNPVSHQIAIGNFAYQPAHIVVATGDKIVWQNADFVPLTVTARDRAWDSGAVAADAVWRFVARTPGRYSSYCVFPPNMQGTIEAH